ncbi:hypothetical protein Skr01_62310 [Sphaerisporangium krabiense]|uniref:Neutral/alkaline non-lysosomal ceramidase N-terminal domain-containing protein n=1 Tax=Sphaerisporangium krabiense TaxID=763782 RepID=A0A7W8Z2E2_9ACTN|nr:hypothetical protein [Sphaerisporangium krabiense]MBB5626187.1 hypothetical protein [Sphaerisporangium krabiense]GII66146.1 hypothetical protein Skr01_62310 [Sphaerisporangium krabiense]
MRAGHGRSPLPVPPGTPLGGYAARTGVSTGVLDELEVAAVTVETGGTRLVWVVADLPFVNVDLADRVRRAVRDAIPGVRPEDVWVSATHTHSGPDSSCPAEPSRTPDRWLEDVPAAAVAAARAAVATERESLLSVRRGRLAGVGGQRSGARPRRTVPIDVLSFEAPDGGTRGLIVVAPVHPTVLGADNLLVSADLTGAARRALAAHPALARDGARPWAVVATGAAGDVSTRPHRHAQTPRECDRLGALVADRVVRALREPARAVVPIGAPAEARLEHVPVPPRPRDAPALAGRLEEELRRVERRGDPVATRTAWTALQAARLAADGPPPPERPSCAVSVIRLGTVALVALGGEPYLDLAARLEESVGGTTVLVGYTNGYLGYLPVRAAYRRPVYEVLRSPVAEGGAERVIARAAALVPSPTAPSSEEHP